ncbi:MarC family protein [Alkalimarinus coralli]|uniref:MarC family protein n=1 Tax=Alkalimarinus coralli TaxID=2935863 RepID=UPI00202B667C|nr:MarC family protein [Alkalimarinus coralli]
MLINNYLKLLFIMTPFFVLSSFITMTSHMSEREKKSTSLKVTVAVLVSCLSMFFFGKYIFELFGITLDAFRIGAGSILFLSAVSLVNGSRKVSSNDYENDIAVVPLAIPITVGPGVIGVLMVMGAEPRNALQLLEFLVALVGAALTIGVLLLSSGWLQKFISQQSLSVMQKITGLFVSAIAAQIIFTGAKGFFAGG